VLFIEYDVGEDGAVELVALVNAVEEDDADPDGAAWMAWRRTHEDAGAGCASVSAAELVLLEQIEDADELWAEVERIVLADRVAKEASW